MGLDTTHDCWHGPYSSFHRWRKVICRVAGLGDLDDYEGFGGIRPFLKDLPITTLLAHSDCDGEILAKDCAPLADALESLLNKDIGGFKEATQAFIVGLRNAVEAGENVEFH